MKSANGKTTGLDLVSNRQLTIASPAKSSQLAAIFNQYIEQGIVLDELKIGKVVPTFKSGKKKTLGTIDLYQYCPYLQKSLKGCSTSNCTNILQTINSLGDKQWGFDHLTLQSMPCKNLSTIGY